MGYDILADVIEITDSEEALEKRLERVVRVLAKRLPFHSCAVYEWDPKEALFKMAVSTGRTFAPSYARNEGVAARAWKSKKPLFFTTAEAESNRWGAVVDGSLRGFRSFALFPLAEGKNLYGLLYLRAARKIKIAGRAKKLLHVIAMQITSAIKGEKNLEKLEAASGAMKDIQAKLGNAERLLTMGELCAALAHEIRTPLVSIGGFAARLDKKIGPDSPCAPYVKHILKEVSRLEGIINDIMRFSEDKAAARKVEELNAMVKETLERFAEACAMNDIKVTCEFSRDAMKVMADSAMMKIAFDNLVANAIESMKGGGGLGIVTKKDKDRAVLEVSDSGGGIEPALVANIFNPFFTTKKMGTGLGLPIAHRIIAVHRGSIEVINDYGRGTTFRVKLPHAVTPVEP
jgi:signal transduction histidine kinase